MKHTNNLNYAAASAIVTLFAGLIYATVQQAHRSTANDPQLQIARDISTGVNNGALLSKWLDGDSIDLSQSLSTYCTLYNDHYEPVLSTGRLNGKLPSMPKGVFDFAFKHGEHSFTWQPEPAVRMAVVLRSIHSPDYSFVAVGRSLYEVELREKSLFWMVIIGWLLCMGVIALHWMVNFLKNRKYANE